MRRLSFFLLLTLAVVLLFSCAKPKVKLSYVEPPKEYRGSIRKIAVLPFESRSLDGRLFSAEVSAELLKVKVDGEPYFKLVSRAEIDRVLSELKFSSSGLTEESARLGRLLKAEGILTGVLEVSKNVVPYREKRFRCVKTEGSGLIKKCVQSVEYYVSCRRYELELLMIPKLIDVERGEIVYSKKILKRVSDRYCSDEGRSVPSFSWMLERATAEAIRELVEDIAPHRVSVVAEFIDDDEGIGDRKSFERAIDLAKEGKISEACGIFESLREKTYALLYNRGLCAELEGDLDRALELYTEALSLRREERVEEALRRLKARKGGL